jgi:outer membrane protein assembly factor BamE (lipoprotein component of BamABCDE complex)
MNVRSICYAIAAALTLGGCASAGNEVLKMQDPATVNQNIVDGKTTRDEVFKIYGAPNTTTLGSKNSETWSYTWTRRRTQGQTFIPIVGPFVAGVDVQQKLLIVSFDENHVVRRHFVSETNNTAKRDYSSPPPPSSSPYPSSTSATPAANVQIPSAPPPPPAPVTPAAAMGPQAQCIRSDGMRIQVSGTACPAGTRPAQ